MAAATSAAAEVNAEVEVEVGAEVAFVGAAVAVRAAAMRDLDWALTTTRPSQAENVLQAVRADTGNVVSARPRRSPAVAHDAAMPWPRLCVVPANGNGI